MYLICIPLLGTKTTFFAINKNVICYESMHNFAFPNHLDALLHCAAQKT